MPIFAAPMFDDLVMMLSVVKFPKGSWSCNTWPAKAKWPFSQKNCVVQFHDAAVQRAGDDDDFESGTRLHDIGDDAVARFRRNGVRLVRVVIRQRGHRQNFAGARAHHDAGDAARRVLLQRVGQRGFNDVLHRRVNGQHHVQAVARLHIFVAQRDQLVLRRSVSVTRQPAAPLKLFVQGKFHAVAADDLRDKMPVHVGFLRRRKTNDLRGQRAVGINPHLVRLAQKRRCCRRLRKNAWSVRDNFFSSTPKVRLVIAATMCCQVSSGTFFASRT